MKKTWLTFFILILTTQAGLPKIRNCGVFVAYETLTMAMNNFQNFAGEIGWRFHPTHQFRLTIMETELTERHLASKLENTAVDGKNVFGYYRGYELSHDKFYGNNFYFSTSIGYAENYYEHKLTDENLTNKTWTFGSGIGYSGHRLLGIKNLYYNLSLPIRFYLNRIEEQQWQDATIHPHVIMKNIWFFIGYKF